MVLHGYLPIGTLHRYYLRIRKSLHKIRVSNRHPELSTVLQSIQDKLTEAKLHLGATESNLILDLIPGSFFTERSGCGKGGRNYTTPKKNGM